jgi:hypothetical protein
MEFSEDKYSFDLIKDDKSKKLKGIDCRRINIYVICMSMKENTRKNLRIDCRRINILINQRKWNQKAQKNELSDDKY